MTRATFIRQGDTLSGVRIKGHAGYAKSGYDIVCSAISVACHMTALGLIEVLGLHATAEAKDADVSIQVDSSDIHKAQPMLRTLELELHEIRKQYPDHIKIGYQERRESTCLS